MNIGCSHTIWGFIYVCIKITTHSYTIGKKLQQQNNIIAEYTKEGWIVKAVLPSVIVLAVLVIPLALPGIPLSKPGYLEILIGDKVLVDIGGSTISLKDIKGNYAVAVHVSSGPPSSPRAVNFGRIYGKGEGIVIKIDKHAFINAWRSWLNSREYREYTSKYGEKTYPTIMVVITLFTPGREYMGSLVIDPFYMLDVNNAPRKEYVETLDNPLKPFMDYSKAPVATTLLPINSTKLIEDALEAVSNVTHSSISGTPNIRPNSGDDLGLLYPPGSPNALMEVYNPALFDKRYSPPQKFLDRIRVNGQRYSKGDLIWRFLMEHFSVKFYLPKSEFSFDDALQWFLLAPGGGSNIYSMDTYVNDIAHLVLNDLVDSIDWIDTDYYIPIQDYPLICVKASYIGNSNVFNKTKFTAHVIRASYSSYYRGLSVFGILIWSSSDSRLNIVEKELYIRTEIPAACIVAPAEIFTMGWDRLIILPVIDEYNINGEDYWVVYGSFMIVPTTSIHINFNSIRVVESDDATLPISDTLYNQLTWSLATSELFYSTVTASTPSPPPGESITVFFIDRSTAEDEELYMYAGSAVSYYFGFLGQMLYDLGLIGEAVETYLSLIGRTADPYFTIAVFLANMISSVNLVIHNAYSSALMLKLTGLREYYTNGDSVVVRIVKDTIGYGAAGFTPTSLTYYIEILPPNLPEPPPGAQTKE